MIVDYFVIYRNALRCAKYFKCIPSDFETRKAIVEYQTETMDPHNAALEMSRHPWHTKL